VVDSLAPIGLIPLLVSPILVVAGLFLFYVPPKKINHYCGYRTKRSKQSQAAWGFAQSFTGKQLIALGAAYIYTLLLKFIFDGISVGLETLISLSFLLIGMYRLFTRVDQALVEKFGGN
jgi:uncharacterized membrane protein